MPAATSRKGGRQETRQINSPGFHETFGKPAALARLPCSRRSPRVRGVLRITSQHSRRRRMLNVL